MPEMRKMPTRASSHCHLKFTGEEPLYLPATTSLTLTSQGSPYTSLYSRRKHQRHCPGPCGRPGVLSSSARLDLVDISDVHTIKTFEAPELGVTFSYFTPKEKHMAPKEVRHKGVPQTEPASQVSDNKMSIAVQPSGR